MRSSSNLLLSLALAAGAVACTTTSSNTTDRDQLPAQGEAAQASDESPAPDSTDPHAGHGAAHKAPAPHSSAVPGTENQLMWDQDVPDVRMEVTSPQQDEVLESGDQVSVTFDVTNYRTGEEIGQHVHVILDNNPYIAHYQADKPLVLEDVAPGTHTLRVFPARHYHLALKEGDVFKTVIFHVEEKSEAFAFDPQKPYLTYSRPKGTYSVEAAQELLLDFYVSNIELGDGARAVVTINDGEPMELTEWKPVLLAPLGAGEHQINLKLVDADGNLIENGGFNNTTRTITVK